MMKIAIECLHFLGAYVGNLTDKAILLFQRQTVKVEAVPPNIC